nr:MAG TPA: Integrin alpha-1 Alpha1, Transmembrane Region, Detergent [Caudoviricetes sp.]
MALPMISISIVLGLLYIHPLVVTLSFFKRLARY